MGLKMKANNMSFLCELVAFGCAIGSAIISYGDGTEYFWQLIAAVWVVLAGIERVSSQGHFSRFSGLLESANDALKIADELITVQHAELVRLRELIGDVNGKNEI